MLARLGHRAIHRGHHEDSAIHLRGARDHVFDVVTVTRAVHVRIVAIFGFVLHVRDSDGQDFGGVTAEHFGVRLGNLIIALVLSPSLGRQGAGDRRGQRGLPMVDVTNRPNVHMWLCALKFLFSHCLPLLISLLIDLI